MSRTFYRSETILCNISINDFVARHSSFQMILFVDTVGKVGNVIFVNDTQLTNA